jgi:RAMP superfamily
MKRIIPFPLQPPPQRPLADEPGRERFYQDLYSGSWTCKLVLASPLCIRAYFQTIAPKAAGPGRAVVPGSSLRGMIRAVAEAIGAGCTQYRTWGSPAERWQNSNMAPCTEAAACLVCRVFGFASSGEAGHASKVRISDAGPGEATWARYRMPPEGRGGTRGQDPGWLVFDADECHAEEALAGVWCIEGCSLPLRVDFVNLDPEEYAVLRFATFLIRELPAGEPPETLYHMLGYAKGLGFGRCQIVLGREELASASPPDWKPWLQRYATQPQTLDLMDGRRWTL